MRPRADDHAPSRLAVRHRARPAQAVRAAARRVARRLRRRRPARCARRRRRAAEPTPSTRRAGRSRTSQRLEVQRASELIDLPPTTHRNLELTQTLRGDDAPTLLSTARHLRHRHGQPRAAPLADAAAARARVGDAAPRRDRALLGAGIDALREALRERQRRRAHHRPHRAAPGAPARAGRPARDAARAAAAARRAAARRRRCCSTCSREALAPAGRDRARCSGASPTSPPRCCATAASSPPASTPSSTSCARIGRDCDAFLLELEARERARTGIANLRVQFNHVHGFYIEVTQAQAGEVPADYQRRQTLKNAERFITPELKAFEDKALSAQRARAGAREGALRAAARRAAAAPRARSGALARALAALDALAALAERRARCDWCRPQFVARAAASRSSAAATRSSRRACPRPAARLHGQRLPARRAHAACSSSPARTWAARAPSCARSR